MKKVCIITNVPSPYRVDFFHYLQTQVTDYHWTILYTAKRLSSREWSIDEEKLGDSIFLQSKVLTKKTYADTFHKVIPSGLTKALQELNPDVVIACEYNPAAILAARWCHSQGCRFVSLTDGTRISERNLSFLQKWSRKYIVKRADWFIASSQKSKENQIYLGAEPGKISVSLLTEDIGPYCDVLNGRAERLGATGSSGEHEAQEDDMNYQRIGLYVGSLIGRKGIDLLFDAIEKSTSDYKIWLVGSGSNEAEYRQRVSNSERLAKTIVFKGYKEGEALMECYRQADFFVFPTREDCFALVLLEAAAAGLPILSSIYADGAYEIIEEGVNGYMADPFDAEAFGKKIDEIVGNDDLAKTTISFNRDMLKKFTFEETAKGYVEAVESALRYMLH